MVVGQGAIGDGHCASRSDGAPYPGTIIGQSAIGDGHCASRPDGATAAKGCSVAGESAVPDRQRAGRVFKTPERYAPGDVSEVISQGATDDCHRPAGTDSSPGTVRPCEVAGQGAMEDRQGAVIDDGAPRHDRGPLSLLAG